MRYIVLIHNEATESSSVWLYPPGHPDIPHTEQTARAQADAWNTRGISDFPASVFVEVEA